MDTKLSHGWIGPAEQLESYLHTIEADQDEEGRFKIYTDNSGGPSTFMGMGDEIVLHGTEEYSVDGKRCNLAAGLRTTSYGLGVMVL